MMDSERVWRAGREVGQVWRRDSIVIGHGDGLSFGDGGGWGGVEASREESEYTSLPMQMAA